MQMAETIQMKEKRCYSVSDLQEMLEISKPAVYELLKRREFHWVMIGGRYKIRIVECSDSFDMTGVSL